MLIPVRVQHYSPYSFPPFVKYPTPGPLVRSLPQLPSGSALPGPEAVRWQGPVSVPDLPLTGDTRPYVYRAAYDNYLRVCLGDGRLADKEAARQYWRGEDPGKL